MPRKGPVAKRDVLPDPIYILVFRQNDMFNGRWKTW